MKYFIVLSLFLVGCIKDGTPVEVNGAKEDFRVELLFSKDECSVYRFRDGSNIHYYTNCKGTVSSTKTRQCGKSRCSYTEQISTEEGK